MIVKILMQVVMVVVMMVAVVGPQIVIVVSLIGQLMALNAVTPHGMNLLLIALP